MDIGKTQLRAEILSRRALLSAGQQAAAGQALVRAVRPLATGRVAAYASIGTEPGTAALLTALDDVLLPVLLPDGDLDWAAYDGELVPGHHGLLEPAGPRLGRDAVRDCAVMIVPALAVDRTGVRLGRGAGSYDRALARTTAYVVAALHAGELVASLPVEPHDRPVHAAVLPDRGLVRLRTYDPGGIGR